MATRCDLPITYSHAATLAAAAFCVILRGAEVRPTNSFYVADVTPPGSPGITIERILAVETNVLTVTGQQLQQMHQSGTNFPLLAQDKVSSPGGSLTFLLQTRALLNMEGGSVLRILPPAEVPMLMLESGKVWFESRGEKRKLQVETPYGTVFFEGTKFNLDVVTSGERKATLLLVEGEGQLSNKFGAPPWKLTNGVAGELPAGGPPRQVLLAGRNRVIQWTLYYPAVLDVAELPWPGGSAPGEYAASLARYEEGDLLGAAQHFPTGHPLAGACERLYRAATLLSVGEVARSSNLLASLASEPTLSPESMRVNRLARALQQLIATVLDEPFVRPEAPELATEWMAVSYYQQARTGSFQPTEPWENEAYRGATDNIDRALKAAKHAVTVRPNFGAAWIRLAALEFSAGNVRGAGRILHEHGDLNRANAQAAALRGFMEAAEGGLPAANCWFSNAVRLDPNLAAGWLGRGLIAMRRGHSGEGLNNLQMAAAHEPQQSSLRSYLAKGYEVGGDLKRAADELALAKQLDPGDPTPWLYGALFEQRQNRVNQAIDDLEESIERNNNRAVYRSEFMLDQDRAVRSANLANIFADAGFTEVSLREATRSVNGDYANAAAHLFLANSYDEMRDPRQIALRYETSWFSEYLMANLLAPVGAGSLSQVISQNEYSKFFQRDGVGLVNTTTWTSNGDWLEEASQYGQFGNFAYALDAYSRSEVGQRPNNDLQQLALSVTAKQQLGVADSVFLKATYYDAQAGDVSQHLYLTDAQFGLRTTEQQEPLLIAGWHHEWRPGLHTLLLVSPWNDTQTVKDTNYYSYFMLTNSSGQIFAFGRETNCFLEYENRFLGGSAELQQIWQAGPQTLIAGVRYQRGEFDVDATLASQNPVHLPGGSLNLYNSSVSPNFDRLSLYAYDQWQVIANVLMTVGMVYDHLTQPTNFRSVPLSNANESEDQVSPKLGLTVTPWKGGVLRGAYTRSLGGVSFDQSFRLEPVQVAGFDQAFRSLMPESLVGSVGGQSYTTYGVGFDQSLPTRTYVNLLAQQLNSQAGREVGASTGSGSADAEVLVPTTFRKTLDFTEHSLSAAISQLVGSTLAMTARYTIGQARLTSELPDLPELVERDRNFLPYPDQLSTLQQLSLGARFNRPCGFFATWNSVWTMQNNGSGIPGDHFWQHNVWVGWRFYQRQLQLAVGVLNLADQDYRLYPLNYYLETYRQRTLALTASFSF